MIRSMTGFGRGRAESADFRVQVDLRSVNHRFLDLRCRLPFFSPVLEESLKERLSRRAHRGKVDLVLQVEEKGDKGEHLRINRSLLKDYLSLMETLRQDLDLQGTIGVDHVAGLPWGKVFEVQEMEPDTEDIGVFLEALDRAMDQLLEMREREGRALQTDFEDRIQRLRVVVEEVKEEAGDLVPLYRDRLRERIRLLTQGQEPDEERLLQEAAFLADRSDITEEITRLLGHLDGLAEALDGNQAAVGKKIDFLLQECHREVNTIGSKSKGADVGRQVVDAKVLVEAMREQAQNIE